MGTRADFYVGRGVDSEWLGSIAWDGYPSGINLTEPEKGILGTRIIAKWGKGKHLFDSTREEDFRHRVGQFFEHRDDVTTPDRGWPWPWETSHTTDYADAFDGGKVYASCFGHEWFDPKEPESESSASENTALFPNMKERQNVTFGARSGVIILGGA